MNDNRGVVQRVRTPGCDPGDGGSSPPTPTTLDEIIDACRVEPQPTTNWRDVTQRIVESVRAAGIRGLSVATLYGDESCTVQVCWTINEWVRAAARGGITLRDLPREVRSVVTFWNHSTPVTEYWITFTCAVGPSAGTGENTVELR